MLITDLEEKLILFLKSEPIEVHCYTDYVYLAHPIAWKFAKGVIEVLKEAAGEPYKDGETEEYTFGGKGYFLILEESKSEPEETALFFNLNHLSRRKKDGTIIWVVDMSAPDWWEKVGALEKARKSK